MCLDSKILSLKHIHKKSYKKPLLYPIATLTKKNFSSKQDFRAHIRAKNPTTSPYASRKLCAYLKSLIIKNHFKKIALFYPLATEPNILPLLKDLKKAKNTQIFLPTIRGLKFKMLPYRLPLVQNTIGIFEPSFSHLYLQKFDFVLIPTLGIDGSFRRIGMGKGMYDRVFGMYRFQPFKVFVSQNLNISRTILTQDFDISANEYVSYTFRVTNRRKKGFNNVVDSYTKLSRIWACSRIKRLSYQ